MTECGARSASLWVHRNLFWQLSRDGNFHGSGMSHATTASPKPSFRATCRVGDAMVGRGNAGWTTSKSGHPCPCQICLKGWMRISAESSFMSTPPLHSTPPPTPTRPNRPRDWTEQLKGLVSGHFLTASVGLQRICWNFVTLSID